MKTIQIRIEEHVDAFVGSLQQLIHEAAIEALQRATGAKRRTKMRRRVLTPRRSTEALASLTEELYRAVCEHPGESMTTFGQALGCKSQELSLCARRLIAQGRVKKAGQRQQARYFPLDAPAKRTRRAKRS